MPYPRQPRCPLGAPSEAPGPIGPLALRARPHSQLVAFDPSVRPAAAWGFRAEVTQRVRLSVPPAFGQHVAPVRGTLRRWAGTCVQRDQKPNHARGIAGPRDYATAEGREPLRGGASGRGQTPKQEMTHQGACAPLPTPKPTPNSSKKSP